MEKRRKGMDDFSGVKEAPGIVMFDIYFKNIVQLIKIIIKFDHSFKY